MNIAAMDAGANLVAFERMKAAWLCGTCSISSRNAARRVFLLYRSNQVVIASLHCFIVVRVSQFKLHIDAVESRELNQSFPSRNAGLRGNALRLAPGQRMCYELPL